jgi:multiple sugar transport system substrate-binding protein
MPTHRSHIILSLAALLFIAGGCSSSDNRFTLWVGGSPQEVDYWQGAVDRFNRATGHQLVLVRQPTYTDQRKQNLTVALASRQHDPDLFLLDVVWIAQFARSGWLMPLDTAGALPRQIDSVFFPSIIRSCDVIDSTLVALPVFLDVALLYYRTDLLQRYGYDAPPRTWEQLRVMAETIQRGERAQDQGFNGFVWEGAQYEGLICSALEFFASGNGGLERNGAITVATRENIAALTFMRDCIHRWHISPLSTYTEMKEEEVRRSFQSGRALFERNWTYAWNEHQSTTSPVRGVTGVTMLPRFGNGRPVSTLGGWHIGISTFTDHEREAKEFIEFVTSYDEQRTMLHSVGWNPSRRDLYADPAECAAVSQLQLLGQALEHTVARPSLPYYGQLSDVMQRAINECLSGKREPDDALIRIQKEAGTLRSLYEER